MNEMKRYATVEDTSEIYGLSVYFLRQGIRAGWIPHIKCGCKNMININKLAEVLDAKEERSSISGAERTGEKNLP